MGEAARKIVPVASPTIDINAFRAAEVEMDPFEYMVVPNFVPPEALARINAGFPDISRGGSFPLSSLQYGDAFHQLTDALLSKQLRAHFAQKFHLVPTNRPATLTVRGHCRARDGRIHTDSKTKLITVLVYLNEDWNDDGGRLRLLRSGKDVEDCFDEIDPCGGTLLAFRCRNNAWHGHKPFVGVRRSVQLNYVTSENAALRNSSVHRISSFIKRLLPG